MGDYPRTFVSLSDNAGMLAFVVVWLEALRVVYVVHHPLGLTNSVPNMLGRCFQCWKELE
jgi:hypothetical protein